MQSDRLRRLAEQIKERESRDSENPEFSALRDKAVMGGEAWKAFMLALGEAVDELKRLLQKPNWEDLTFACAPNDFDTATISKHQSPYIECSMKLANANTCIQGTFKTAPRRPASKSLSEKAIKIDLKTNINNEMYYSFNGKVFLKVEELAAELLNTIIIEAEPQQKAQEV